MTKMDMLLTRKDVRSKLKTGNKLTEIDQIVLCQRTSSNQVEMTAVKNIMEKIQ